MVDEHDYHLLKKVYRRNVQDLRIRQDGGCIHAAGIYRHLASGRLEDSRYVRTRTNPELLRKTLGNATPQRFLDGMMILKVKLDSIKG